MKPKVLVLTTGGTIGHRSQQDGVAVMDFDPQRLIASSGLPDIDLEFRSIFRKGSMDIGPDDWVVLAEAVAQAVAQAIAVRPRGVVILHGTDTMHYTAAALAFMLRELGVPVVMTGSMIPGGDSGSDAIPNLRDAIVVAAEAEFAEVCIVFSADAKRTAGVIIRGCRARKVHSHAIDGIASVNVPAIGTITGNTIVRSGLETRPRTSRQLRLATDVDRNAILIKLTPADTPESLARQLQGASGAVLEGTGVGHIRTDLQPVVSAFGKPTVVATQTVYGGERLGSYDVDRNILSIPHIIPAGDMNSDCALVKLMWALGQGGRGEDVRSIMRTDLAGEISVPDAR